MELTSTDYSYLGIFLEGFFFGMISVNCQAQVAKVVQYCLIPGLYSGIFAMYLQHHGSPQRTNKAKSIVFYALLLLYTLSAAIIVMNVMDILPFFLLNATVSMDDHGCWTLFQLVVQNIKRIYCTNLKLLKAQ